jgi:uncharacterized protein
MTPGKTYSLRANQASSDEYYRDISALADTWLAESSQAAGRLVSSFQAFLASQNPDGQTTRSIEEITFEIVVLGVLLNEHGAQAVQMPGVPAWMLARLVEAQDRMPLPAIEKPVKAVRGLIQGLAQPDSPPDPTPVDSLPFPEGAATVVARLVTWLQAAGNGAQAARMADWRDYLAQLDEQSAQAILARCLLLAEDFAARSSEVLGKYTENVDEFVNCAQAQARWRYDGGLMTRSPVEYHLGMLGTEILTRAYRQRFRAMARKIVIVPDCLCARSPRAALPEGEKCQAELTSLGLKCQGCTPGCRVLQITRLGEKRGFEAYILPDDLRGIGLGSCSKLSGVGVVGVSCALTNWDAGWMVNDSGVPAQGVLLDYAGCKSHWHQDGVSTDLNLNKLLETIEV